MHGFGNGLSGACGAFGVGHWLIGGILGLVFVAVIVTLVVVLTRRHRQGMHFGHPLQAGPSAKEIAQLRYAKGEISQTEYKKIVVDLDK